MYNQTGKLVSKNRANLVPEGSFGKQIFLCIHPADREKYYEVISDLFLQVNDSFFVWSHKDPVLHLKEEEAAAYLDDLRQNQIFVACITRNFLQKDDICVWEFERAIELGMNVLPLLLENDVVDDFNQLSNHLMAFEPFKQDPTVIPFEEKFASYLGTMLGTGSNPYAGIENAFDGHIFISYRKKDRKYIAPLMKAIHANYALKAVSIWYDESLVISDSAYDDQIKEVINQADLCILLATEHTLEDGNYVATEEYPYMCEQGKPILTIIADETPLSALSDSLIDEAERSNRYAMPVDHAFHMSDADIFGELVESLLFAIGCPIGRPKSADELYMLGLAYKNHYLLERSAKDAIYFFRQAINAGRMDGFEQVEAIYEYGIGMETDEEAAVNVQEQYVHYLLDHQTDDFQCGETTYCALSHLVDMYRKSNDDCSVSLCDMMVRYAGEKMEKCGRTLWKHRYYSALLRYAELLYGYGKYETALKRSEECYRYYLELADQFVQKGIALDEGMGYTRPEDIFAPLAQCFMNMSKCEYRMDHNQQAVDHLQHSINIKINLYNRIQNVWALSSLYKEYQQLAKYLVELHMYDAALSIVGKDYQVLCSLFDTHMAGPEHEYAYVENLILTGDIAMFMGNGREKGLYQAAREQLAQILGRDRGHDGEREAALLRMLEKR